MRYRCLKNNFSATSDPILIKFSLLESSQRGEFESGVRFIIIALDGKLMWVWILLIKKINVDRHFAQNWHY